MWLQHLFSGIEHFLFEDVAERKELNESDFSLVTRSFLNTWLNTLHSESLDPKKYLILCPWPLPLPPLIPWPPLSYCPSPCPSRRPTFRGEKCTTRSGIFVLPRRTPRLECSAMRQLKAAELMDHHSSISWVEECCWRTFQKVRRRWGNKHCSLATQWHGSEPEHEQK